MSSGDRWPPSGSRWCGRAVRVRQNGCIVPVCDLSWARCGMDGEKSPRSRRPRGGLRAGGRARIGAPSAGPCRSRPVAGRSTPLGRHHGGAETARVHDVEARRRRGQGWTRQHGARRRAAPAGRPSVLTRSGACAAGHGRQAPAARSRSSWQARSPQGPVVSWPRSCSISSSWRCSRSRWCSAPPMSSARRSAPGSPSAPVCSSSWLSSRAGCREVVHRVLRSPGCAGSTRSPGRHPEDSGCAG